MTTIAWDGVTLAGDRRSIRAGYLVFSTNKLWRTGDAILGASGDSETIERLRLWYDSGARYDEFPSIEKDAEATLMAVFSDGSIAVFRKSPLPVTFPPQNFAIGSGADFAMAAMYLGKPAKEAVEVAAVFDCNTGNGVDTLTH